MFKESKILIRENELLIVEARTAAVGYSNLDMRWRIFRIPETVNFEMQQPVR